MTILFNTPDPSLKGGPPTHLPWLEAELRKHITVVPFQYGRKSDNESSYQKVVGRVADLFRVRSAMLSTRPDLIHHNSAFDPRAILRDAPLAALARRHHIPLFIKVHGSLPEAFSTSSRLVQRLRSQLLRDVTHVGVLSQVEKDEFESAFPLVRGKVSVVKNILKPDFFAIQRQESEQPTVIFISRCIRLKGVFDLLDAVPLILQQQPRARFIIVGDGEDAPEVDRVIRARNLDSSVERRAHCSNSETTSFYTSAHVFVFPTHYPEGMPMVVAEAMAAGVPLVTTRTRFSMSVMEESTHCLYVDKSAPDQIATSVCELLRSTKKRSEMSHANRTLAQQFSATSVTQEFLEIYNRILADHSRGAAHTTRNAAQLSFTGSSR